ncbi:MAG TPA: FHA domain-containing protein [Polyangiaceae bacterium]
MALKVSIRSGDLAIPASITFDAPRVVIGRGEGSEVRLPDPSVSHRHASIRQRGADYVIVDEGSTNGTFVGGVRLSPQAPRVIRNRELVRVGRVWLELEVEQALATANPQGTTREIALRLVEGALRAQGERVSARVIVKNGADQGKELGVTDFERTYVIGRGPESDLAITDKDASRRHVEILRRGESVCVRDLGSKNGTELGQKTLESGKDTAWPAGATLRIGDTEFALEDPLALALAELEASPDEAMRSDELVEPPAGAAAEPESVPPAPAARPGGAPIADVPKRAPSPPGRRRGGLRPADIFVGVLALVVLALSLLGLAWVLRSD